MIKNLIFFASVLLFFASCTNNNLSDLTPKKTLENTTIIGPNTSTPGINTDTIPTIVSLQQHVLPIFDKYSCRSGSCHGGTSSAGGVYLGNYNGIQISANNGQLYKSIAHLSGATPMPSRSRKMSATELATVKKWIDSGAPNN